MARSAWSGRPPRDEAEARARLCAATLRCVARWGLARAGMSDIAREAGVTRPTLYKHFRNKTEAFVAAIDWVALDFARSVARHAARFASVEERIVETVVFVARRLPRHKYLSLVFDPECAAVLGERAFAEQRPRELLRVAVAPVVELRPDLAAEAEEIAEVMARFAISVALFPGPFKRSNDRLRRFVRRRLLPGLLPRR